jgi:hypothetical protein
MKNILALLVVLVSSSLAAAQWDDCPAGRVNDTYPGDCGGYVDTDGDGVCDHSQPPPAERSKLVGTTTTTVTGDAGTTEGTEQELNIYNATVVLVFLLSAYVLWRRRR